MSRRRAQRLLPEDVHVEQEQVFAYDWYALVPPTLEELDTRPEEHAA
jgi:hypothetical protein